METIQEFGRELLKIGYYDSVGKSEKKTSRQAKLFQLANSSLKYEWLKLIESRIPSWPNVTNHEWLSVPRELREGISSLFLAKLVSDNAGTHNEQHWAQLIFPCANEFYAEIILADALKELSLFFSSRESQYHMRQLQLGFKDRLALIAPKYGFMTQYLLAVDEIDEDIEMSSSDERCWKTYPSIVDAYVALIRCIREAETLQCSLSMISPPLFQLLDDSSSASGNAAMDIISHLTCNMSSKALSFNHFHCVLLEALLNRYWMWSIASADEKDQSEFVIRILEAITNLLEKDSTRDGKNIEQEQILYESYLCARYAVARDKSSRTRIDPSMPWLAKVDQFWCQLLQIGYSVPPANNIRAIHFEYIKKWSLPLGRFIQRNLKSLIKTISIYSLGADFELTVSMMQFLRVCMLECSENIESIEGELMVFFIDFGNQLHQIDMINTLGDWHAQFMNELRESLSLLCKLLLANNCTQTLLDDWEALRQIDKLNVTWAEDIFDKITR